MGGEHQAQVDELVAGYRRSRELLVGVQRELAALAASVTSACGTVTATVGAHGGLVGLELRDDVYRVHRPEQLAQVISLVVARAAGEAARRADVIMAPALPAGTDPAALRDGMADLGRHEVEPPPEEDAVDEFDFERATWMRSDKEDG